MFTENKINFSIALNLDDDEIHGVESMIRLLQDLVNHAKNKEPRPRSSLRKRKVELTKIESESDSNESETEKIIEPVSDKVKNLLETMTRKVEGVVERDAPEIKEAEEEVKEEVKEEIEIPLNCFTQLKNGSVECKCGSVMEKKNINKHKKTVKHVQWAKTQI